MAETAPAQDHREMRNTAARGAVVTIVGQAIRCSIQIISIIILSRLLGPSIIGLFALLMVVVAFGEVIRDSGLSSAVIQAKHVTQSQLSNLFWINCFIGAILAGLCVAIAPVIASFYGKPELFAPCAVIGAVFLFGGLGTQFRAQMSRDLKFTAISAIDVVAAVAGVVVAVSLAVAGFGVWALVAQQIVIAVVAASLNAVAARWKPSMPSRRSGTRQLLTYGWHVGLTQIVNAIARNVDTVVIGRIFGTALLGIYSRAFDFMRIPLNQLSTPATNVAFPVLSRLREDVDRYNRYVLIGQRALVHIVGFLFVFAISIAPIWIDIALGSEWQGVASLYQILAVGALAQAAGFATYWVFLSKGKSKETLQLALATRTVLVLSVLGGSTFGVYGVAIGYSVTIVLTWPFGLYWLHRACREVPTLQMFQQALAIYLVYGLAGVAAYTATAWANESSWVEFALAAIVYAALASAVFGTVGAFRRDLREILALRHLLRRGA